MSQQETQPTIATHSIEEGLDFACNLLAVGLSAEVRANPEGAAPVLESLSHYITLRYVGEFHLALEELSSLGAGCGDAAFRHEQFLAQLAWLADAMHLTTEDRAKLVLE